MAFENIRREIVRPRFDPFAYTSHTEILRQYIDYKKRMNPSWSARGWAGRLGMKSAGALVNICKGKRIPDSEFLSKLSDSMGLSGDEREYFITLAERARQSTAQNPAVEALTRRIGGLRVAGKTVRLSTEQASVVIAPAAYFICSLVSTRDFSEDPNWIAARLRFGVDPAEVPRIIRTLLDVGLLERDSSGRLAQSNVYYETETEIPSADIQRFHCESLDIAKSTVLELPPAERFFSSEVLAVHAGRLPEAKAFLNATIAEFNARFGSADGSADEVYQLNVQYVPVTEKAKA